MTTGQTRLTHDEARDHVGSTVTYTGGVRPEVGVITSVNDSYVFVRYGTDQFSAATSATDLLLGTP